MRRPAFTLNGETKDFGYGRLCELDEAVSASELVERVRAAFGNSVVRYVDGGKPIRRVAVGSGDCAKSTVLAIRRGMDAYITGDIKHDQFLSAKNAGMTLIDAGHFHTENIIVPVLQKKFSGRFPDVEFIIANCNIDPLTYLK